MPRFLLFVRWLLALDVSHRLLTHGYVFLVDCYLLLIHGLLFRVISFGLFLLGGAFRFVRHYRRILATIAALALGYAWTLFRDLGFLVSLFYLARFPRSVLCVRAREVYVTNCLVWFHRRVVGGFAFLWVVFGGDHLLFIRLLVLNGLDVVLAFDGRLD